MTTTTPVERRSFAWRGLVPLGGGGDRLSDSEADALAAAGER